MQVEVGIYAISNLNFLKKVKLLEKIKIGQKDLVAHAHAMS